jgi:hypothetical protein
VALGHLVVLHERYAGLAEGRADLLEDLALLYQEFAVAGADRRQLFGGRLLTRVRRHRPGLGLLHQPRDADLEELVHVAGEDRQELGAFQERVACVAGLVQHAPVELQRAELAVDVGELGTHLVRGRAVSRRTPANDRCHVNPVRLEALHAQARLTGRPAPRIGPFSSGSSIAQ